MDIYGLLFLESTHSIHLKEGIGIYKTRNRTRDAGNVTIAGANICPCRKAPTFGALPTSYELLFRHSKTNCFIAYHHLKVTGFHKPLKINANKR